MSNKAYQNPTRLDYTKLRDPAILNVNGGYYLYGTSRDDQNQLSNSFNAWYSRDLITWSFAGEIYNKPDDVTWNKHSFCAPDIAERNNRYYLFYSAASDNTPRGIGLAASNSPLGPFVDIRSQPIGSPNVDCIDPHLYTDPGGTHWLLYAHDGRTTDQGQFILQKLSGDLTRAVGEPVTILTAFDVPWANTFTTSHKTCRLIEAPQIFTSNGRLYLIISTLGEFGYCIGYFTADKITGPYTDRGTIINHDAAHSHCFIGPDGHTRYICYHSPTSPPGSEVICIDEIRITDNGLLSVDESKNQ